MADAVVPSSAWRFKGNKRRSVNKDVRGDRDVKKKNASPFSFTMEGNQEASSCTLFKTNTRSIAPGCVNKLADQLS